MCLDNRHTGCAESRGAAVLHPGAMRPQQDVHKAVKRQDPVNNEVFV
jgi:hypothetical protein